MSSKDRIQQILDVKKRASGMYTLEDLRSEWLKNRRHNACTPDFYVIRAVTVLEVFTSRSYAGAG